MHTIAIVNQKGGCGKTTTAINLAGVFAAQGYRTLLVDMDPQGHCAAGLAIPEQRIDKMIGDAMLADDQSPIDADRLLWRVSRNLDLAPSTTRLAALEAARGELANRNDPEQRLKKALSRFAGQYDVCLIDCSPAIGLLTFNSLVAADEIIVPVETGFFSLQGATKQINAIKALGKRLGVAPTYRLLATLHDPKSMLSKDLLEEIRRRFAGKVIPVVIRHDVCLREAASFGQPVIEYSKNSTGAEDYSALADWLRANALGKPSGQPMGALDEDEHLAPAILSTAPAPSPASSPAPFPAMHDSVMGLTLEAEINALDGFAKPEQGATSETAVIAAAGSPATTTESGSRGARAADVAARAKRMQQGKPGTVPSSAPGQLAAIQPSTKSAARESLHAANTAAPARSASVSNTIEAKPVVASGGMGVGVGVGGSGGRSTKGYGVRGLSEGEGGGGAAEFILPATIGKRVSVAGEFNGWSSERTPLFLSATGETWEGIVEMPGGANQYRLVVDGAWIADPYNPNVAPNPFGGTNSVVMVPPKVVMTPPKAAALVAHGANP